MAIPTNEQMKQFDKLKKETESFNAVLVKELKTRDTIDKIVDSILGKQKLATKLEDDLAKSSQLTSVEKLKQRRLNVEAAKETKKIQDNIRKQLEPLKKAVKGAQALSIAFRANPVLAFGAALVAVVKLVVKLNEALAQTRKDLGVSAVEAAKIKLQIEGLGLALKVVGLSAEDAKSAFDAIRENFGGIDQSTNMFVANLARATLFTGASADNLAQILAIQESVSDASRETLLAQLKTSAATIRLAGVAPGAIFKDLASDADAFALNIKDGGANLIGAATQARKLGLEFKTVTGIADKLLDFESSIENQLKASLLIGRDINLDRARTLALNNDLTGALEEVVSQVGGEAEFNELNRIQRAALADSVGVSVSELSRLVRDNANAGAAGAAQVALSGEEVQNRILATSQQIAENTGKSASYNKTTATEIGG